MEQLLIIAFSEERDPTQLFEALGRLKATNKIQSGTLKIRFRASVHDDLLNSLAAKYNITEIIDCQPPIAYRDALSEMLNSEGLLVMQAPNCNEQIPAKIYEYLRTNRPVLALTDPAGDTATTLRNAGIKSIALLDSSSEIEKALLEFIDAIKHGRCDQPITQVVEQASREGRTAQLAKLLESCSS